VLRAVHLASNPAQAVQDRATGAVRGDSADVARGFCRRIGVLVEIRPVADPQAVIDAVSGAEADIGFVVFAPERVGKVDFSQVYMWVQQSFLVLDGLSIRPPSPTSTKLVTRSPAHATIRSRCS